MWMVSYQQGLPNLVYIAIHNFGKLMNDYNLWNKNFFHWFCSAVHSSLLTVITFLCLFLSTPAHIISAVQCSAVQCSAVQCSTVQCSAVQYSAVQCSAVQCSAVQRRAVQCFSGRDGPSGCPPVANYSNYLHQIIGGKNWRKLWSRPVSALSAVCSVQCVGRSEKCSVCNIHNEKWCVVCGVVCAVSGICRRSFSVQCSVCSI